MNKTISTTELKDLQRSKEGFAFVNVLSQEEFRKGSIPGSKNAPVDRPDFLKSVADQTSGDMQKHIVVYCAGPKCDASTRAAKMLTDAGYTHVEEYRGGMEEWNASSSGGRGQQGAGTANQDNRGNAGEKQRSQGAGASHDKEKSTGHAAAKVATQPQEMGASSSINRSQQAPKAGMERGNRDETSAKNQPTREAGVKATGPGLTTSTPHPDVMQPQSRAIDPKSKPSQSTAPKAPLPAQAGQKTSTGPAHESPSNP